jgi:hypothetical protein
MFLVEKEQKGNNEIQHAKLYCLIQCEDYAGALKTIEQNDFPEELVLFEKAYCFYKLNRQDDALTLIHRMSNHQPLRSNDVYMKLKAQIVRKQRVRGRAMIIVFTMLLHLSVINWKLM